MHSDAEVLAKMHHEKVAQLHTVLGRKDYTVWKWEEMRDDDRMALIAAMQWMINEGLVTAL